MKPLIIANWKMNLTFLEARFFAERMPHYPNLIIAPPTPYLGYLAHNHQFTFCAQDVSIYNDFGSYTGENSAKFFKSCMVNYAIVGHTERRKMCGETNIIVQTKAQNCIDNDITPIICIGETLDTRQDNKYIEFLTKQLKQSLPDGEVIIAYEPIWSIGTGIVPSIFQIREIIDLIRSLDSKARVVYGGSVNSKNCRNILNIQDISGLLVGSASLNQDELVKILNC